MKFCSEYMLEADAFIFGDDFQELFRLQGLKPYIQNKENVKVKENEKNLDERYKGKIIPWDIEHAHLIKYREQIRQAPLGIRWTKEELDKYNSLSDVKLKRAMILKKSELKSVYIPHLKWDKEMIKYPNMPHDMESKDNFKKGFELFQERNYEEAYPYLKKASLKGNYIASELVAKILLKRLDDYEFSNMYTYAKDEVSSSIGIGKWLAKDPENNQKILNKHDSIINEIKRIALSLDKQNLPIGQFLLAEIEYHFLSKICYTIFDVRYRGRYIKHLMQAANNGSYDACLRLAITDGDLEWILCAMIISHDYKCFDKFVNEYSNDTFELASPRNLAIVRLAAMWGSSSAMDCLTFGSSGNIMTVYKHQILDGSNLGAIYMPDSEELYRRKIYNKYYGEQSETREGNLIPDLDTVFPPKPVLRSPYGLTPIIDVVFDQNKSAIHPLSKDATEESMIVFRKDLYMYEKSEWLHRVLELTKKYKEIMGINDARYKMAMVTNEEIDMLFGYLNAIKMRELEQNPLYYPSGRPFIYPASIYKKYPDWY